MSQPSDELIQQALTAARKASDLSLSALAATPDSMELLRGLNDYYTTLEHVLQTIMVRRGGNNAANRVELAKAIQEQGVVAQALNLHRALQVLLGASRSDKDNIPLLESLANIQMLVYKTKDAARELGEGLKKIFSEEKK